MGLYSHYTADELTALRSRLMAALHDRLTGPSGATTANGRSIQYQNVTADLRKELADVNTEIARRNGQATRRPIYMV